MKMYSVPKMSDIVAILIGTSVTLFITGGVPLGEEQQEVARLKDIKSLNLGNVESDEGMLQSYDRIYTLYKPYYTPPEGPELKQDRINVDRAKGAQDTLEVDNKLYQLQATFISEQAMAVIMVKSKEGKLEDTVLLKKGEKIGRYVITQVNRTEVVLAPDKGNQPLFLKLFELDIKE
ncbi:hypothetical protein DA096_15340 [Vibrio rotiferianus]|uniref:hypothetical protein n=1 Tax=Vibrio rotiferianus TaxID=190895 RepID=UPI0011100653|nr:hypothetical protein [Vibrio rotiferianus]TMX44369.1 hypothetical protein DA095_00790 [Vibrio rotiferianus]TMX48764.1 hypothetical protein DA093_15860 [Vibrio rotiferianus]TMX61990.1 hypothetical protein DA096_15340 [Vibrio rotiferianus]